MAFAIKALLGIGTLKFFSIWDESIDWDSCPFKPVDYVGNPLKYADQLVFKEGKASSPIHCRAPDDLDLVEVSTAKVMVNEHGERDTVSNPKKEQVNLFRRCVRAIDNYEVDDEKGVRKKFEVVLCRTSDGREWADEATMKKIPMELASEIGSYLLRSQVMTEELKNV